MRVQELASELAVLVEILSEFQQQNDNIRVRACVRACIDFFVYISRAEWGRIHRH